MTIGKGLDSSAINITQDTENALCIVLDLPSADIFLKIPSAHIFEFIWYRFHNRECTMYS